MCTVTSTLAPRSAGNPAAICSSTSTDPAEPPTATSFTVTTVSSAAARAGKPPTAGLPEPEPSLAASDQIGVARSLAQTVLPSGLGLTPQDEA
jgi:hypothetical protein